MTGRPKLFDAKFSILSVEKIGKVDRFLGDRDLYAIDAKKEERIRKNAKENEILSMVIYLTASHSAWDHRIFFAYQKKEAKGGKEIDKRMLESQS